MQNDLVERLPYVPCPTCGQYSHSIGTDAVAAAFNHFQTMIAHPVRGHPMGDVFDEQTKDAAQLLTAEIRRLRGLVEELTERGVKVVIAYHVAICSPEGIVPDDEFYDPIIAARVERSLESARATLSRLEP